MDTNTLRAWRWLRSGDTGISSETIWSVMMGEPPPGRGGSIPHDPADFGRCHRLLALFPEWRPRLPEMAAHDPAWGPMVKAWDELTALYLEELPTGEGRKLWARMQELKDEGRLAAGWTRTGPRSWSGPGVGAGLGRSTTRPTRHRACAEGGL